MSSESKQHDDSIQVTSSTAAADESVEGTQVNTDLKLKQRQGQAPTGVERRETIFSLHVHRKLTFKTIHFIEQLTALNFTTFSNITWKLLEKRWKDRNSVPNFCKSLEKIGLIVAANFLMLSSSYCTGVFISLVPQFEDEFWDNGTLVQLDHLDNIEVNEGIGVLQSTGQAVTAVFGVVTGCVVTAAKGTLKGRILAINLAAGIYGVCTIVGMMLADSFWTYYVAYAMFMAGQGIVSAIALPTQLLIASSKNQLVVQGVTVISKYAGMIVGMAVTAFLFQSRDENSAHVGEYTGGFSGLQSCLNNITDEAREGLGTFDLWACMDSRMRSYFPVAVLALFTLCLFLVNPRTWKHVCSSTSCGKRRGVFENRFYDLRSRRFSAVHPDTLAEGPVSHSHNIHAGGKNSAKVAPSAASALSSNVEGRGVDEQVVDLETMSEEDTMRLLFHEIFVPHSQCVFGLCFQCRCAQPSMVNHCCRVSHPTLFQLRSRSFVCINEGTSVLILRRRGASTQPKSISQQVLLIDCINCRSSLEYSRHMSKLKDLQPTLIQTWTIVLRFRSFWRAFSASRIPGLAKTPL